MTKALLLIFPLVLTGWFHANQSEPEAEPRTVFVPSLLTSFDVTKSTLWCGTSVLAWKALLEAAGDRVGREALVGQAAEISSDPFGEEQLKAESYVAVGGLDAREVLKKAKQQLAERFDGRKDPWLEESAGAPVLAYAYLARALKFVHTFQDCSDTPLVFGQGDQKQGVESFGFRDLYSRKGHKLLKMQTRVMSYEGPDRFVCKLSTEAGDQILIARLEPAKNLALTWQAVVAKMRATKKATSAERAKLYLESGDSLVVPKVDFDLTHEFGGLILPLEDGGLTTFASQSLRVRLDEKGADVESRNSIRAGLFEHERKDMVCDGPFLLAFIEKGAEWPYCMVWVANTDLLVRRKGVVDAK